MFYLTTLSPDLQPFPSSFVIIEYDFTKLHKQYGFKEKFIEITEKK